MVEKFDQGHVLLVKVFWIINTDLVSEGIKFWSSLTQKQGMVRLSRKVQIFFESLAN